MMTEQTIVAVYDKLTDADAAVRDLEAASVPSQAISRHEGRTEAATTTPVREEGFWARLFGSEPDHDTSIYDRSIESGSSVVAVRVSSEHVDHVSSILETHHPIDLDERSAHYRASGTTTTTPTSSMSAPAPTTPTMGTAHTSAAAASENGTVQLAEETLAVGKRAVSGATTHIRRFAVETPVQEQVSLRDETVTLERHAVTDGRPVGATDFADKSIEMTETSEEAVVSKTAHVVEEVNLRKDVTDRVETVKDTVRRDEVEIEKVTGEGISSHAAGSTPVMPTSSPKV
jgi:uncharacterized protein (TIGR02271 family)